MVTGRVFKFYVLTAQRTDAIEVGMYAGDRFRVVGTLRGMPHSFLFLLVVDCFQVLIKGVVEKISAHGGPARSKLELMLLRMTGHQAGTFFVNIQISVLVLHVQALSSSTPTSFPHGNTLAVPGVNHNGLHYLEL